MVIDTSALIAILQREPERRAFIDAIEAADVRAMSVATSSKSPSSSRRGTAPKACATWIELLGRAGIELCPGRRGTWQGGIRRLQPLRQGSTSRRLELRRLLLLCARDWTGEPLLFKGDDFVHTDVSLVDIASVDLPSVEWPADRFARRCAVALFQVSEPLRPAG